MNSYDEPIRCSRCGGDLDEYATHDNFGPVCDTCSKQPDETATSPEDRAFEAWVQEEPSREDTLFGRAYTQDGARRLAKLMFKVGWLSGLKDVSGMLDGTMFKMGGKHAKQ